MEGFCRGCLIRCDEPSKLLPYTEKNGRLYSYCTGIRVKQIEISTFQLCKDCHMNMKLSCKFKKQCRTSNKKYETYLSLKEVGDAFDLATFLKSNDELLRLSLCGNSTPAQQGTVSEREKDDDNESTCTSIRNFMTDILQGEEMPDTEAHIIKEVIEEQTGLLEEDTLDSQWLQDDISRDTDFRDLSFSPFSTPRSINIDHCYTPNKRIDASNINNNNVTNQNVDASENKIDGFHQNTIEFDTVLTSADAEKDKNIASESLFDEIIEQNVNYITQNENDIVVNDSEYHIIHDESYYAAKVLQNENQQHNIDSNHVQNQEQLAVKCLLESNKDNSDGSNNYGGNDNYPVDKVIDRNKIDIYQVQNDSEAVNFTLQEDNKVTENVNNEINQIKDEPKHLVNQFTGQTDLNQKSNHDELLEKTLKITIKIEPDHYCDNNLPNKDVILEEPKIENDKPNKLDDLLVLPREGSTAQGPSTPMINNILFGEKLDLVDDEDSIKYTKKLGKEEDILDEILNQGVKEFSIHTQDSQAAEIYDLEKCYCKTCDKKFKMLKGLKIHLNRLHSIKLPETRAREFDTRPRMCSHCGAMFNHFKTYQNHMQSHSNVQIECSVCKLVFLSQSRLKRHMKSHGPKEEDSNIIQQGNFVCATCGKAFKTSAGLSVHTKRHLRNYLVTCEECGKGFYRKTDLETHMRVHKGEKPFECKFCESKFTVKYSLVKHMKLHLGDKPFQCDNCSAKFVLKSDLIRHLKISKSCLRIRAGLTARKQTAKTYQCAYCKDVFNNKPDFVKHQKNFKPCETLHSTGLCIVIDGNREITSEHQDVDMMGEI